MNPRVVTVTLAQRRVIGELCRDGADNLTIARRLHLSDQTVKSHLHAVLHAAGVPTRTALVVALARGQVRLKVVDGRLGRRAS